MMLILEKNKQTKVMKSKKDADETCKVCKLIRIYLIVCVPMLIVLYTKPEISALKGILLTDLFATIIGVGFVVTIWKSFIPECPLQPFVVISFASFIAEVRVEL